ncbi:hypothetical protein [Vibrio chagasii]|uniref:hypothetical protein n=1 Tax=Vibrio chagasii TaxID=170679 RepID=UPI003735B3FC
MPVRVIIGFLLFVLSINVHASVIPGTYIGAQIIVADLMNKDLINSYEDCINRYSGNYPKCKELEEQWSAIWNDEFYLPPSILKRRIKDIKNTSLKNN